MLAYYVLKVSPFCSGTLYNRQYIDIIIIYKLTKCEENRFEFLAPSKYSLGVFKWYSISLGLSSLSLCSQKTFSKKSSPPPPTPAIASSNILPITSAYNLR